MRPPHDITLEKRSFLRAAVGKSACMLIAVLVAGGVAGPALQAATTYSITENVSYFGWLDQFSVATNGNQACVPTASVNAMTYLQNLAPGYFGTSLTGTNYATWRTTDETLMSPSYMDTTSSGTYYNHLPYALNKYITQDKGFSAVSFSGMFSDVWNVAPYDKPAYITNALPNSGFFINSLTANNAIVFSIEYPTAGTGHELLAAGIDWTDLNDDGIIQFSENASLKFVDPLDPSATYPGGNVGGIAKFTSGRIWNKDDLLTGNLIIDYQQYQGGLPFTENNYSATGASTINTALAITVPEPRIFGLLVLTGFGLAGTLIRRRRQSPRLAE